MSNLTRGAAGAQRSAPRGHGFVHRIVPLLLSNPLLHRLLSRDLMLITFTGRTSGRSFTTPVTYTPSAQGGAFFSNQRWWTNLRGGAPVTLRLQGQDITGRAEPVEDRTTVMREARAYLQSHGAGSARKIGLPRSSTNPTDAELEEAVRHHVVVYVTIGAQ